MDFEAYNPGWVSQENLEKTTHKTGNDFVGIFLIKMLLYPTGATRRSHLTLSPGFLRSFHEVKYPEDMTLAESYILLPVTVNKCSR